MIMRLTAELLHIVVADHSGGKIESDTIRVEKVDGFNEAVISRSEHINSMFFQL